MHHLLKMDEIFSLLSWQVTLERSKHVQLCFPVALKKLDETCAAEDSFARALALAPQDPLVLINYAVFLESEGKVDRAREMLTVLNDAITIVEIDSQVKKCSEVRSFEVRYIWRLYFVSCIRLPKWRRNWALNFKHRVSTTRTSLWSRTKCE